MNKRASKKQQLETALAVVDAPLAFGSMWVTEQGRALKLPRGSTPHSVADQLVNHYKDHSFVIDVDEATQLLGPINEGPEEITENARGCGIV